MKVKELIDKLKKYPEDLLVITDGHEDGYEHIVQSEIIEVCHKPENQYYSGEFQDKEQSDNHAVKAVVIYRKRRDTV